MHVRFLLGPAGSGKTFRCLAQARAALTAAPDGDPLVFLAPKQATFQLERQLLGSGEIAGFTRLQILSFDRLAQFIFEKFHLPPPRLMSAEGRLMVLRALLWQHEGALKLLRGSARRPGFAQELGALLAELQQHQFGPAKLRALAADENLRRELRDKLHDLALLTEKYTAWLREHDLQDANCLLDLAAETLRANQTIRHSSLVIQGLWLDGFAEMTPQELALLAAIVPFCKNSTLAFCLETEPTPEESWLSIWSAIGKTFQSCRSALAVLPGCEVETQILQREPHRNRFAPDSALAELEQSWALPVSVAVGVQASACPGELPNRLLPSPVSIAACANPDAEAVLAAREILKFVRSDKHNRFRDCAVLVRDLENYHQPLARVFRRYEIPFFLDRRESVAHHPLAELTRSALRTVAFDWQNDDWFAALKAGFAPVAESEIDALENIALEFGWRGRKWREPLPDVACERLRKSLYPPFENLLAQIAAVDFRPTGEQLAAALRNLWADLGVEQVLEQWALEGDLLTSHSTFHQTVFSQMQAWLDNVALAFSREPLPLRDWLPILEAGLGNLTVGVIPPALDEVLVGAIDRARNPELKFALLLGLNESVFPAAPVSPVILTHSDRDELDQQNAPLGADRFDQISRERFLGYIACTRANEKLFLSFSRKDADGATLSPSPFIAQVQKNLPQLEIEEFSAETNWYDAEHANELAPVLAQTSERRVPARLDACDSPLAGAMPSTPIDSRLLEIPALKSLADKLAQLREPDGHERLSPLLAEKIYGPVLKSSVSRLEEFAQCPFQFFIRSGLHANERKQFELDARERGNFQHDVLKIFHEQLQSEGKRWRDLTPAEARKRIGVIAAAQMELHRDGLFRDSAATTFAAHAMTSALQDFMEVIIGWMHSQYAFDPAAAEIGFGGGDDVAPAWEIDLGGGRKLALQGRIDRVDLCRDNSGHALAVVTDYKSGGKKLDSLLVQNGIQLQLLAYLAALRQWKNPQNYFGEDKLMPAGAFYVSLRGKFESGDTRDEILADADARRLAYRHNGRFDAGALRKFDGRTAISKGDQFNFRLNKDGSLPSNSTEALPAAQFTALLDDVEAQLRRLGTEIFSGAAQVDPYRKGQETPCGFCDYRATCRIDEWTHEWRELRAERATENSD